jgi:hypothetical protein
MQPILKSDPICVHHEIGKHAGVARLIRSTHAAESRRGASPAVSR